MADFSADRGCHSYLRRGYVGRRRWQAVGYWSQLETRRNFQQVDYTGRVAGSSFVRLFFAGLQPAHAFLRRHLPDLLRRHHAQTQTGRGGWRQRRSARDRCRVVRPNSSRPWRSPDQFCRPSLWSNSHCRTTRTAIADLRPCEDRVESRTTRLPPATPLGDSGLN